MPSPTTQKAGLVRPTPAPASNSGGETPAGGPRKQFLRTRWSSFCRCPTHRPCHCAIARDFLPRGFDNDLASSFARYCRFAMTTEGRLYRCPAGFRGIHNEDGRGGPKPYRRARQTETKKDKTL